MNDQQKRTIRAVTRGAYDLQKLRIMTGNRLCANFRAKLGLNEEDSDEDDKDILRDLQHRFKLITDGVIEVTRRRDYDYDGVITSFVELNLIANYLKLAQQERRQFRELEKTLEGYHIWEQFLRDISGVGPAMAGVIISEFNPHRGKYVSSFWKYAGLDVAEDGRGRSRRQEHLVDVEYEASDGSTQTRKSITFNPFLKTKLLGVLATSFLRCGNEKYRKVYDDYRHRLDHAERHNDKSAGHKHRMALRYMIKMFIRDLYVAWRPLEGLPVHDGYAEKKLGHDAHGEGR